MEKHHCIGGAIGGEATEDEREARLDDWSERRVGGEGKWTLLQNGYRSQR